MRVLAAWLVVVAAAAEFSLQGKVCYITGATSGLGEYVAMEAAKAGCKVSMVGRRAELGEALRTRIAEAGGTAIFHACDVADEACVEKSIVATVEAFGSLDYALNNAGGATSGDRGPPHEMSAADFDKVMSSNVKGAFLCLKHQTRAMLNSTKTDGFSIVNVGSVYSVSAQVLSAGYVASKHALSGLTKTFGVAYARHGIRVNNLAPTYFETPLTANMFKADALGAGTIKDWQPSGTYCQLPDLWGPLKWLWSDDSAYYTAQNLIIDGGLTSALVPPSYMRQGWQRTKDILAGNDEARAGGTPSLGGVEL